MWEILSCTWGAAVRGKDLIKDHEVKAGLKKMIEERAEHDIASDGQDNELGIMGMMNLADNHLLCHP